MHSRARSVGPTTGCSSSSHDRCNLNYGSSRTQSFEGNELFILHSHREHEPSELEYSKGEPDSNDKHRLQENGAACWRVCRVTQKAQSSCQPFIACNWHWVSFECCERRRQPTRWCRRSKKLQAKAEHESDGSKLASFERSRLKS